MAFLPDGESHTASTTATKLQNKINPYCICTFKNIIQRYEFMWILCGKVANAWLLLLDICQEISCMICPPKCFGCQNSSDSQSGPYPMQ